MYESRNLHRPGCTHADTYNGWTVFEVELPASPSQSDSEAGEPLGRVCQTLACLACDIAYVRVLTVHRISRTTTARALALGWPAERVAGCELIVTRTLGVDDPQPCTWQVRRDGHALGLIAVTHGPRHGIGYTAGLYPPATAAFHPRYTTWNNQPHPTGNEQRFTSRTAAVRWVRDHAPTPTGPADTPHGRGTA